MGVGGQEHEGGATSVNSNVKFMPLKVFKLLFVNLLDYTTVYALKCMQIILQNRKSLIILCNKIRINNKIFTNKDQCVILC